MKIEHVSYAYDHDATKMRLADVSFELQPGLITSLIGPNGAGKTTLFNVLTRQLRPSSGSITLAGRSIAAYRARDYAQHVAAVHQHNHIYDDITVYDLVRFGQSAYHSPFDGQANEALLREIMDLLHVTSLKDQSMLQLSGGQQQRVWLAMALAQQPQYLLLDEPTTYLDLHYQGQFLKLLQMLKARYHLTILIILHDLNQALSFSDHTLLLAKGQLVADDTPENVITPANLATYFAVHAEMVETSQGLQIAQLPD